MKLYVLLCALFQVGVTFSSQKAEVQELRIIHFKLSKKDQLSTAKRTIEQYLHPIPITYLESISDTTTNSCKAFLTSILDLKNDKTKFSYNLNSTLAQQWGLMRCKHNQHYFLSPLNNKIYCLALYDTL